MSHKSKVAFEFSVDRMFEVFDKVYFWTLTWPTVQPDWRYPIAYDMFMKELQHRHGGLIQGLRVVEVHEGGHGLHYHLLVSMRIGVRLLRAIAKKYGIGRVQVTQCNHINQGKYLAKYLSKGGSPLTKGMRRWGTIGGFVSSKKNDIVCDSIFTRNMGVVFGGLKVTPYETSYVFGMSMKYGEAKEWPMNSHKYTGDPVWTQCSCPVCVHNRGIHKQKSKVKTYWLLCDDKPAGPNSIPFTMRPKCPKKVTRRNPQPDMEYAAKQGY
jgi:hypothetical protein